MCMFMSILFQGRIFLSMYMYVVMLIIQRFFAVSTGLAAVPQGLARRGCARHREGRRERRGQCIVVCKLGLRLKSGDESCFLQ